MVDTDKSAGKAAHHLTSSAKLFPLASCAICIDYRCIYGQSSSASCTYISKESSHALSIVGNVGDVADARHGTSCKQSPNCKVPPSL